MIGDFLKNNIQILRPSKSSDGGGAYITTYPVIAETFGYLEPMPSASRRANNDGIQQSPVTHNLFLSGSEDIKIKDRIKSDSMTFEVIFIGDFRRYKTVELNQLYGQQ